jgi:hypothetical protein
MPTGYTEPIYMLQQSEKAVDPPALSSKQIRDTVWYDAGDFKLPDFVLATRIDDTAAPS